MAPAKNDIRLSEPLFFATVFAVVLAAILPPLGLILGLGLRFDYRERPRNRRVATGAVWLALALIGLWLGTALLGSIKLPTL